jgi:hypothetical protein
VAPVLGLGALALAIFVLRRRRSRHAATDLLEGIEARLKAQGVDVTEAPLEELSTILSGRSHPLAGPLAMATRRYLEARFAGRPLSPAERDAVLAALERRPWPRGG